MKLEFIVVSCLLVGIRTKWDYAELKITAKAVTEIITTADSSYETAADTVYCTRTENKTGN